MINKICIIKNKGFKITKDRCFVLWWNRYMPINAPILPPIKEIKNNTFSGMRHNPCLALNLSTANNIIASRLIIIR